jgi:hypothetical protein
MMSKAAALLTALSQQILKKETMAATEKIKNKTLHYII